MTYPLKKISNYCEKNNISLLLLFGSRAANSHNRSSDLDLGVLFESDYYDYEKTTTGLIDTFEKDVVDIVVLNHSDPLLNFEIISNYRILYCRDEDIFFDFYIKAVKQHQDMQKIFNLEKGYLDDFIGGKRNGTNRCHPPQID